MIYLPNIGEGEDKSSPLKNRIRKNYKHVRKWAKRTQTNCFRLYDKDIPAYPVAIDYYDNRFCIHFFAKGKQQGEPSEKLIQEVNQALRDIFLASDSSIYWRIRQKTKETRQYEKKDERQDFFPVIEYGIKFLVNLTDYLDTGLFLDHRETRRLAASHCQGKRVLNLFAYTCSFSVHAAMAGASFTKSVDLSNTYLDWGKENFLLNDLFLAKNEMVRDDCMKYLEFAVKRGELYDVIIIDPPTISRSKKMEGLFDVQEDYLYLIGQSLKLLSKGGITFFSTNSRKFKFDPEKFPDCNVRDITKKTLPIDFRDEKIHYCWQIEQRI